MLPPVALLLSCSGGPTPLDVTEQEIDAYVEKKMAHDQVYEIIAGPRYSREVNGFLESYESVIYKQNDTVILTTEYEVTSGSEVSRNTYYMDTLPVLREELRYETSIGKVVDRKTYLNGVDIIAGYERSGATEEEAALAKYRNFKASWDSFQFERAEEAANQQGDYEMKFGEFLIMPQAQYLILENENSKYNVALVIFEGDELINSLFTKPDEFKGKTIRFKHEFMDLSNVIQMVYRGGKVVEVAPQ